MPWQDNKNKTDCGIYAMRHLENFDGEDKWLSGINRKNAKAKLHLLRLKYIVEIIHSDINDLKDEMVRKMRYLWENDFQVQ